MPRPSILASWIISLFLLLLSVGSFVSKEWLSGLLSLAIALLCLPPLTRRLSVHLHRFARYGIAAVLAVLLLVDVQSSVKPLNRAQNDGVTSSSSSASSVSQADPVSILDTLRDIKGISVDVFDTQGNMGSKAQPPMEIIVQSSASDCFDSKMQLFDVMKAVYTNQSLKSSVGRVVFVSPPFLRASLEADAGYRLSEAQWDDSGPTNFYKVLKKMHDGDGDPYWQTWVQTLSDCL